MNSYAEDEQGRLFVADGQSDVLVWDGLTAQMERAGLDAPTTGVTIAGSGTGAIAGSYNAFLRFVNRYNDYSNLSPIQDFTTIEAAGGGITGVTNTTPITYTTDAAHGLGTGDFVNVTGVGGNDSANTSGFVTVLSSTSFSIDGSATTADYNGGGTWSSGVFSVDYSDLETTTDTRVVRRQILRNTDGQANVYYVDIDTDDLSSTVLHSTNTDEQLSAQEPQPVTDLIISSGDIVQINPANVNTPPPNHKPFIARYQSRMWYAGSDSYDRGCIEVAENATTVTGIGTGWTTALEGRYLFVPGAVKSYQITAVVDTQTLTLGNPWLGSDDKFLPYSIRTSDAEGELVYYSEAGKPASVPATNAFFIPYDSDLTTGLMDLGSFLYVLKRHSMRKITVQNDPATDGAQYLAASRGCVNNRCWVKVDDMAYLLDTQGIYAFPSQDTDQSMPIQDIFRPDTEGTKINWAASRWFHAVHFPSQQCIYWFVALEGSFLPRHALVFNYRLKRWSIDKMPCAIGASALGNRDGIQQVYLSGEFRQTWLMWSSVLDLVDNLAGTVRGQATSASLFSLTDVNGAFADDVINSVLFIVDGKGKGQARRIVDKTATTLTVKGCWLERPDSSSVYQVGAIPWNFRSGWFRLTPNDKNMDRRIELVYKIQKKAATMDVRFFQNFQDFAEIQWANDKRDGVTSIKGKSDFVFDLTYKDKKGYGGVAQKIMSGNKELYETGLRFSQFELGGTPNQDSPAVYQIVLDGYLSRNDGGQG